MMGRHGLYFWTEFLAGHIRMPEAGYAAGFAGGG